MKIIVSYSGGKDSQACLINAAKKYGAARITAVFCDTGWEHPVTYEHVQDICSQMGVELVILRSAYTFVSLAKYKKRFPSTKARFCTTELKVKPMIDYILSLTESCIIIQGIRAGESIARAKMLPECSYFADYFQPKENKTAYSYRRREVVEWCAKHDASVLRPVFLWSAQEVIDCILAAGLKPNPLYYRGLSRVGCFPCMMCRMSEIREILKDEPMKERLLNAERMVGHSFFAPDYIPKYACQNGHYPMVEDVFRYVSDKNATLDMFAPDEGYACMSLFHGLCE